MGRAVSPVLPVHCPEGGRGFDSRANHINFTQNHQPTTGCHVAAHDWATWHLNNQPKHATCQIADWSTCACHLSTVRLPRHCPVTSAADVIRATCHPYSGDTCHPWIGPAVRQINLPRSATCHHPRLPHVISRSYHVSPSGAATSATWTVRTVQSSPFFACLLFGQNAISCSYGARLTK
jgi:hypothetical protein